MRWSPPTQDHHNYFWFELPKHWKTKPVKCPIIVKFVCYMTVLSFIFCSITDDEEDFGHFKLMLTSWNMSCWTRIRPHNDCQLMTPCYHLYVFFFFLNGLLCKHHADAAADSLFIYLFFLIKSGFNKIAKFGKQWAHLPSQPAPTSRLSPIQPTNFQHCQICRLCNHAGDLANSDHRFDQNPGAKRGSRSRCASSGVLTSPKLWRTIHIIYELHTIVHYNLIN